MNCREVQDKLGDYLEVMCGDEARKIALHLESCERCRREYHELRNTIRMVKKVRLQDPGPDFWRVQREEISGAAHARMKTGFLKDLKGIFGRVLQYEPTHRRGRFFSPVQYRLAGALLVLLFAISGIIFLGDNDTGSNRPRDQVRFVFNERELGEAYVSGALFGEISPVDELNDLNDQELRDVFTIIANEYGFVHATEEEGVPPLDGKDFDIEYEIRGLDPSEIIKLLDLLDTMS